MPNSRLNRTHPKLGNFYGVFLIAMLASSLILVAIICYSWDDQPDLRFQIRCPTNASVVKKHSYNRSSRFIFIGDFPHSGGKLIRELLRISWQIQCSEESVVISKIIKSAGKWTKSNIEKQRLELAGLNDNVISDALASFIVEIIFGLRTQNQTFLCNHDSLSLLEGERFHKLFPQAKFILIVRDGRAVAHSLVSSRHKSPGYNYNLTYYRQSLMEWSQTMEYMLKQCNKIGEERCIRLKYEDLVLFPNLGIPNLRKFLGLGLAHQSQKFKKLLNKLPSSVNEWIPAVSKLSQTEISFVNPILQQLGYDSVLPQ